MYYAIWSCKASCSLVHFKLNCMLNLHDFLSIKRISGLTVFIEGHFLKQWAVNDWIACIASRVFTVMAATLFLLVCWEMGTWYLLSFQGPENANMSSQKKSRLQTSYPIYDIFVQLRIFMKKFTCLNFHWMLEWYNG